VCERAAAHERLSWCRHLMVLEDGAHANNRATLFLRPPNRSCRCERFGHHSIIPSTDGEALMKAFKQNWCASCQDRSPRRPQ
jgi:hypothetical protein